MRWIQCPSCFRLEPAGSDRCHCGYVFGSGSDEAPAVHMFPAGWWEHLDLEPVYIKNRKQLRQFCADRDVRAMILD